VESQEIDGQNELPQDQRIAVKVLENPDVYPKPPAEVTHKETHISHLFFAGDLVYKIKKPVRYSFLDYSSLDKRRRFLGEELRLNRRLAPSVYLGITPITKDSESHWRLGGDGDVVEYALVMRRLPEKRMLPFLLNTHQVTPLMMNELAETVAKFHKSAERMDFDPRQYVDAVEKEWRDNLLDLEPFVNRAIEAESLGAFKDFGTRFLHRHDELFAGRPQKGWIRDVHGDLHCEHVCFAPEGIQIFDCIEFSSKLRCCDLASEIAFLIMDLEVRGAGSLVQPFLSRYSDLQKDPDLPVLLPFYKCYRALVRGKVHALRSPADDDGAKRYFRFAHRFTWESVQPLLIVVFGLTGSGKSTLAQELGDRLGMTVINSDAVRKALTGRSGRQNVPFNTGIYSQKITDKTYQEMARKAEEQIVYKRGVVLDATFSAKSQRQRICHLGERYQIPVFFLHCAASEETTKKRLAQRARENRDISDGRWEIYLEQARAFQPVDEFSSGNHLELNTEIPVGQIAHACEKFLRSRLE